MSDTSAPENDCFLVAALPPSNMISDFARVQRLLFRTFDEYEALALPPLIPIQWVEKPISITEETPPFDRLTFHGYELRGDVLVSPYSPASLVIEGTRRSSVDPPPSGCRMFPTGPFVAVARLRSRYALRGRQLERLESGSLAHLPRPPEGSTSVFRLVCMQIVRESSNAGFEGLWYQIISERWVG